MIEKPDLTGFTRPDLLADEPAESAPTKGPKVKYKSTPEASKAHNILNRAIAKGKIHRPNLCEECGSTGNIEGAHYDYSQPLNVEWLCKPCHSRWDRAEPKGGAVKK